MPDTTRLPSPDLRIVNTQDLIPHEYHDEQRMLPLVARIQNDGMLRNPPIVTPLPQMNQFLVLDGANRVGALRLLETRHTLVQVVPYEQPFVRLSTWNHVLSETSADTYINRLQKIDGLSLLASDLPQARESLDNGNILAYCVCANSAAYMLIPFSQKTPERNQLLNAIVNTYASVGRLNRSSSDDIDEVFRQFPTLSLVFFLPKYRPSEIVGFASSRSYIPPGITRHIISGRALRVNYRLVDLYADLPLEEKNNALKTWLSAKYSSNQVRYYTESTFLFDE
nr:hypothetical protein [Anaerolineae bacterium]